MLTEMAFDGEESSKNKGKKIWVDGSTFQFEMFLKVNLNGFSFSCAPCTCPSAPR